MPHLLAAFLGFVVAMVVGATTDEIIRTVYDSSNTAFRVNVVAGSASSSDITSGTTTITGGSDKSVCFDDSGVINCADAGLLFDKTDDNLTTRAYAITVPNAGATGTTVDKLAKVNSSGQAVIVSTSDTDDAIGICVANCGTTGNATIALLGSVDCVFDSATTAGNYIGIDGSTAGACTDLGATFPTTGVSVLGRVLSTNGAGGTYAVNLNTPDVASVGSAGGGGKNPAGVAGNLQTRGAGNNFAVFSATNDSLPVGNGTIHEAKVVPDCDDSGGNHLNYDQGTNAFTCGTTSAGGAFTVTSIINTDSPYSLSSAGNILLLADTSSGSITVNLPDAAGNTGKFYHIKKTSASNTLTLDGDGADTIDGTATWAWTVGNNSYSIASDGTNWRVF